MLKVPIEREFNQHNVGFVDETERTESETGTSLDDSISSNTNEDDMCECSLSSHSDGEGDPPIFEGSDISTATFNKMFLGVPEKHSLSKKTQSDLLKLINIVLPPQHTVAKNSYEFSKGIDYLHYDTLDYAICSTCHKETTHNIPCQNKSCEKFGNGKQPLQYTIQ